jgi:hypothetical protein
MIIVIGALVIFVVFIVIGNRMGIGSRNSTRKMMRGKAFRRHYTQYREEAERLDAEYRRSHEEK